MNAREQVYDELRAIRAATVLAALAVTKAEDGDDGAIVEARIALEDVVRRLDTLSTAVQS